MQENIVLYDADCKLCKSIKKRIEQKDTESIICFIPQSSDKGKGIMERIGSHIQIQNSLVYLEGSSPSTKFDAVLKILRKMGKYRFLYLFLRVFPKSVGNMIYEVIARFRHKL